MSYKETNTIDKIQKRVINGMKTSSSKLNNLIVWLIIILLLYTVNISNDLLYHTLTELFCVLIAYIVFIIIWKSKSIVTNRYLILLGIAYFFIGNFDLLHVISFRGLGTFPVIEPDPSMQFYLIARYFESTSFLIAPLFLTQKKDNEIYDSILSRNPLFARNVFIIYSIITACLLVSILYLKIFPTCYIVGSGDTPFYEISEYIISFTLLASLVLLYMKRDIFDKRVFEFLELSIFFTLLGEMPYLTYSHMNEFPLFVGHFFKAVSFYYLYIAFVASGIEQPFNNLIRKCQQEEVLKKEASLITDEQNHIYSLLGVKGNIPVNIEKKNSQGIEREYSSFIMQNFNGILFKLGKDFLPMSLEGSIEGLTGYSNEDFLSGKVKWADIVIPEYLPIVLKKVEHTKSNLNKPLEKEYRIRRKNGEIRWVRESFNQIFDDKENFQVLIYDITQRKKIEENLRKQEEARIKEIHHRIKNNLQVISSLLDLQAEKFGEKEAFQSDEILNAFKDSQNRVISMALIHEELYNSKDMATLDFACYLQKLATDLLYSYSVKDQINLKLNLEQVYLGMETAIPLGIIVNELISNSLKHAFKPRQIGKISIGLYRNENCDGVHENSADSRENKGESEECFQYILVVADNGSGIPKEIDIENTESLGLHLVCILSEEIEAHLELKRDVGTEFRINFNNK